MNVAIGNRVESYEPLKTEEYKIKKSIVGKDNEPVYRARRLSQVNKQLDKCLRDGIVQLSLSEYASPIVVVKRRNDPVRLCVDYRKIWKIAKYRAISSGRSTRQARQDFLHSRLKQ